MNPTIILALISDLYERNVVAQQQIAELTKQLEQAQAESDSEGN